MKKKQQAKAKPKKTSAADNETAFFNALRSLCLKHKVSSLMIKETSIVSRSGLEFDSGSEYEVAGYLDPFADENNGGPKFEIHVRKMGDFKEVK